MVPSATIIRKHLSSNRHIFVFFFVFKVNFDTKCQLFTFVGVPLSLVNSKLVPTHPPKFPTPTIMSARPTTTKKVALHP